MEYPTYKDISTPKKKKGESFWVNDYRVLFRKENLGKVWIDNNMTYAEKLNATTRFIILITLVGYMTLNNYVVLLLGVILISIVVSVYYFTKDKHLEGMANYIDDCSKNVDADKHSDNNPMYNVLLSDYTDNPDKPALEEPGYSPEKECLVNKHLKNNILQSQPDNKDLPKIFETLDGKMNFDDFSRQFTINPSTSIPNDQDAFLKSCFGNLYSGKPLTTY